MNRKITNMIRLVLDECIPPVIRDARWFMYPIFYIVYRGKDIGRKMDFKSIVYSMSEKEYNAFYGEIDAISGKRDTDCTESNIKYILKTIFPQSGSIIDIGCGKGYLLNRIRQVHPDAAFFGLDLEDKLQYEGIEFTAGSITRLPFPDNRFDTVICTHTIEHIIPLQQAIDELIRITAKQLIIVTPCQRYYYYTLDGHVNFFYKAAELLRFFRLKRFNCIKIGMDWIYTGYKDPG